jgi:TonB-dependent SusC/RagA subfamily outer membrane receptor
LIVKLIRLAYAAGIILVSGGCASGHVSAAREPSAAQPLYVIDGRIQAGDAGRDMDPDRIASVEVVKGPRAVEMYGRAGANGVIVITTKQAAARAGDGAVARGGMIRVGGDGRIAGNPLVLVDGRAVPVASLRDIATDEIVDIEVLRGPAAVERYGDRATDGVVVVRTKHGDDML